MITLSDYWMGRNKLYAKAWTGTIQINGCKTVERVNRLLALFEKDTGIKLFTVNSGWRPVEVNDATSNAGKNSRHITAEACDMRDTAARDFAQWCLNNLDQLSQLGLWMERPQWTPTWVHLQIVAPGSGHRVYIPSTRPPLVKALQNEVRE